MARFNSTKVFNASDKIIQEAHNRLTDLLDEKYYVQKNINGVNVEVTMSPEKPFELMLNGRKYIYVTPSGILVDSIYDVNEDGFVDQEDYELIKNYILSSTGYLPRMDVNGDGVVNSADLTAMIRGGSFKAFSLDNTDQTLVIDDDTVILKNANDVEITVSNHNGFAYAGWFEVGSDDSTIGTHVIEYKNTTIPANAIIVGGTIHVNQDVTSGGAATVALGLNGTGGATNSIMDATAVGSLTAGTIINSKTTFAAPVKVTTESQITITIATADLTNGQIEIFLQYFLLD